MYRYVAVLALVACQPTPKPATTPSNVAPPPAAAAPGPEAVDRAQLITKSLAYEAFPQWAVAHPDRPCPASIAELGDYTDAVLVDPWGHPYRLACGDTLPQGVKGILITSAGPDGQFGTGDDVRSDRE